MRFVNKKTDANSWADFFSTSLKKLKNEGLYRQLRVMESPVSPSVTIDGCSFLLFCSNDYLGLATDSRMKAAAAKAALSWGTGSGASRLISGNISLYRNLEKAVVDFKQTEAALIFSSGYAANVGVISSLVKEGDLILSDALNHASIVDACRLSKAQIQVYPHGDVNYVKNYLSGRTTSGKVLVVTDGVFSMTGDLAPLPKLNKICRKYRALLMVDDAHGTGVIGPKGGGTLDYFNMDDLEIVQVGTFSKALGGLGGFVTGSFQLIDFLINNARPLIYSTALPPAVLASNYEGIRIIQTDPSHRETLAELVSYMRDGLVRLGFQLSPWLTPILPIVIGDVTETILIAQYLWRKGIFVPPIRPPTVPQGKSCLRISLSALHTRSDLDRLLLAIEDYYKMGRKKYFK